jgi:phosphatidylserine/phosphatidylglycerophosphate/cardiolipin synthase-like enzyme
VDDCRAFVSSANFTEAAQEHNIEAGVLIVDPAFARALRDQFESLVAEKHLTRVPMRER